jgi:predicted esterase
MSPFPWVTSGEASRLSARPAASGPASGTTPPGLHVLDLGPGPEVLVRVPTPSDDAAPQRRLVLTLHGAGGDARGGLAPLLPHADHLSHGRTDTVLPIDRTSRRIVPQLEAAAIPTEVHEFDGPHIVPPDIAEEAARWLAGP